MVGATGEHVPQRGDVIWVQFSPHAGHEQGGRRPALVLSGDAYNARVGLCICVPITSRIKGYPFEVVLADDLPVAGAVLADQVRTIDWRAREATVAGTVPEVLVEAVVAHLLALVEPSMSAGR